MGFVPKTACRNPDRRIDRRTDGRHCGTYVEHSASGLDKNESYMCDWQVKYLTNDSMMHMFAHMNILIIVFSRPQDAGQLQKLRPFSNHGVLFRCGRRYIEPCINITQDSDILL
jgi:hypothetical protein